MSRRPVQEGRSVLDEPQPQAEVPSGEAELIPSVTASHQPFAQLEFEAALAGAGGVAGETLLNQEASLGLQVHQGCLYHRLDSHVAEQHSGDVEPVASAAIGVEQPLVGHSTGTPWGPSSRGSWIRARSLPRRS